MLVLAVLIRVCNAGAFMAFYHGVYTKNGLKNSNSISIYFKLQLQFTGIAGTAGSMANLGGPA